MTQTILWAYYLQCITILSTELASKNINLDAHGLIILSCLTCCEACCIQEALLPFEWQPFKHWSGRVCCLLDILKQGTHGEVLHQIQCHKSRHREQCRSYFWNQSWIVWKRWGCLHDVAWGGGPCQLCSASCEAMQQCCSCSQVLWCQILARDVHWQQAAYSGCKTCAIRRWYLHVHLQNVLAAYWLTWRCNISLLNGTLHEHAIKY